MKAFLYFSIAVLTVLAAASPPQTRWDWVKLCGAMLSQGLLAIKALQSDPKLP